MIANIEDTRGKTPEELAREGFWFAVHTLLAVLMLFLTVTLITVSSGELRASLYADNASDYNTAKLIGTLLALIGPAIGGFFIARARHNEIARYVWISGLLMFSVICVWVLDLPTGPGMCEHCGALEKLWRTFFDIYHGSGLMGEQGLVIGTWTPLAMIGYAVGASYGLGN